MTKNTQPLVDESAELESTETESTESDSAEIHEPASAASASNAPAVEGMISLAQYQSLAAEYANYQKRTEQHLLGLKSSLEAKLLVEIAPLLDNLALAKNYQPQELADNQWANGLIMIGQQAQVLFESWGITAIPTVGESFDPRWHEAIAEQPATDKAKPGQIMIQVEAGYRRGDQVLRVAKVIVAA